MKKKCWYNMIEKNKKRKCYFEIDDKNVEENKMTSY
jgi:hypothetical protein